VVWLLTGQLHEQLVVAKLPRLRSSPVWMEKPGGTPALVSVVSTLERSSEV
jgi:hypothetical protein